MIALNGAFKALRKQHVFVYFDYFACYKESTIKGESLIPFLRINTNKMQSIL